MIDDKKFLITGGTGSFGETVTNELLRNHQPKEIVIYSRDEKKQFDMRNKFDDSRLKFIIGDVREREKVYKSMSDIDFVFHAAALKQVPTCEFFPMEAIKTNIIGAENVIEAGIDAGVSTIVALSTDKASAPINLYGATKLTSDKLFISANNYKGVNFQKRKKKWQACIRCEGEHVTLGIFETELEAAIVFCSGVSQKFHSHSRVSIPTYLRWTKETIIL